MGRTWWCIFRTVFGGEMKVRGGCRCIIVVLFVVLTSKVVGDCGGTCAAICSTRFLC